MIGLGPQHHYYLYRAPTDMRKGFDGLSGLVKSELGKDPLDGSVYLFINRSKNRMKILFWNGGGFWLYYKRLERGTFEIPDNKRSSPGHIRVNWNTLLLMVEGVELKSVRMRKRFELHSEILA